MRSIGSLLFQVGATLGALLFAPGAANALAVVNWTAPANGATFGVGSTFTLSGNANGTGTVGGSGLDLALVLDGSGSMADVRNGQTKNAWLRQAATSLVNALPAASTSVAVIEFDSAALVRTALTPLATGKVSVQSGINAVGTSGGTNIPVGINAGTLQVTGAAHTSGRTQMLVVVSDGISDGDPAAAAAAAVAAGVDAVHSVGLPGHDKPTMQAIAASGKGVYTDGNVLTQLISIFDGTAGNLVGIDHVDLLMNDGTQFLNIALDGLGNFTSPTATIFAGVNTFKATAFDTSGNTAVATLTLIGGTAVVPEPDMLALVALALGAAAMVGRGRRSQVSVQVA